MEEENRMVTIEKKWRPRFSFSVARLCGRQSRRVHDLAKNFASRAERNVRLSTRSRVVFPDPWKQIRDEIFETNLLSWESPVQTG